MNSKSRGTLTQRGADPKRSAGPRQGYKLDLGPDPEWSAGLRWGTKQSSVKTDAMKVCYVSVSGLSLSLHLTDRDSTRALRACDSLH